MDAGFETNGTERGTLRTIARAKAPWLRKWAVFFTLLLIAFQAVAADPTILSAQTETEEAALFPIVVDGKWGYIDRTGKVIVSPQFQRTADSSEGIAVAYDGRWRLLDSRGQELESGPP
jgi:hypothetical protein